MKRKNPVAKTLSRPKFRPKVIPNKKKALTRRPKHQARAADAFPAVVASQADACDCVPVR